MSLCKYYHRRLIIYLQKWLYISSTKSNRNFNNPYFKSWLPFNNKYPEKSTSPNSLCSIRALLIKIINKIIKKWKLIMAFSNCCAFSRPRKFRSWSQKYILWRNKEGYTSKRINTRNRTILSFKPLRKKQNFPPPGRKVT